MKQQDLEDPLKVWLDEQIGTQEMWQRKNWQLHLKTCRHQKSAQDSVLSWWNGFKSCLGLRRPFSCRCVEHIGAMPMQQLKAWRKCKKLLNVYSMGEKKRYFAWQGDSMTTGSKASLFRRKVEGQWLTTATAESRSEACAYFGDRLKLQGKLMATHGNWCFL